MVKDVYEHYKSFHVTLVHQSICEKRSYHNVLSQCHYTDSLNKSESIRLALSVTFLNRIRNSARAEISPVAIFKVSFSIMRMESPISIAAGVWGKSGKSNPDLHPENFWETSAWESRQSRRLFQAHNPSIRCSALIPFPTRNLPHGPDQVNFIWTP
ncbi:hypothetical protein EAI_09274 [Harpegnathos saltator]|uniref:Uncharacterized protein n=1 Tax=Harpegnathos saltator TaxID=610380 RepID=E2BPU8_HARSA|nr:hypothetical protein EAI_09274 [Harpegnathos saltator]